MDNESKQSVQNSVGRAIFVALSILLQAGWIVWAVMWVNDYYAYVALFTSLLALVMVLRIYGTHINAAFKFCWAVLILIFPVFGLCLYFLCGRSGATRIMRRRFEAVDAWLDGALVQDAALLDQLGRQDLAIANQCRYICNHGKYPIYQNTDVEFYADAALGLTAQLEALGAAERFIFMEYHAIEDSQSFHRIRDILAEKAAQGVDVRLFYDDMGSIGFLNRSFIRKMEALGIQCRVFNPLLPVLNVVMNNRDHRKITVVDGRVGFTGGYNLADEYFNLTQPYGHWKDTGIKLTGDAVRSLTVMFLEMWNAERRTDACCDCFLSQPDYRSVEQGYVQPYADSPLDQECTGENVYLNLIKNAKRYVYFTTPYLIIDDEMQRELTLAAQRGVDVRIITPGIPDKKVVFQTTRSYYAGLARRGVRIYEYTPGFIHAKQAVCDGESAIVGTINLDFRSLYLHFENGCYLYNCSAVADIKSDFDQTFPLCSEVTGQYHGKRPTALRIGQCILRFFAPLM